MDTFSLLSLSHTHTHTQQWKDRAWKMNLHMENYNYMLFKNFSFNDLFIH